MSEQRSLEPQVTETKTRFSEESRDLSGDKGATPTINGDEGVDLRKRGRDPPPSYHRKREITKRLSPSRIR